MTALSAQEQSGLCPICRQQVCSLLHVRDRLGDFALRAGARLCLYLGLLVVLGILAGWWSP